MPYIDAVFTPQSDRIEHFLKLLIKTNAKFNRHMDAYKHLVQCLEKVERIYKVSDISYMAVPEFARFNLDQKYQLYYRGTVNQVIFLNQNGAYGIYKNPKSYTLTDLALYKKEAVCLVNIPSKSGQPLWLY